MGYTLQIGNAVPNEDDGREYLLVENMERKDAPAYGEPTDYTNSRWPSYSAWADFCEEVGLYDMFYNKKTGLLREHPGCVDLTPEHLAAVREAIELRKKQTGGKPAGFAPDDNPDDDSNDPQLARLTWLEYWMNVALSECKRPAFYNS